MKFSVINTLAVKLENVNVANYALPVQKKKNFLGGKFRILPNFINRRS